MRKKYLSALLFGALLVTSAGTFTSCKDYDDEINNLQEQITTNKDAIAALQKLVGEGKWVTSISPIENGFTVTMSDGSTQNITGINGEDGQDGKPGTVITLDPETNNWIIDGVDTGVCAKGEKGDQGEQGPAGENGQDGVQGEPGKNAPSPSIDPETGCWIVYEWDATLGDYKAVTTEVYAKATKIFVVEGSGFIELNIDGEKYVLPTTSDSYTVNAPYSTVKINVETATWNPTTTSADYNKLLKAFPEIGKIEKKTLLKQGAELPVLVTPANIDLTEGFKFSLQTLNDGAVEDITLSNPTKGLSEAWKIESGEMTRSADTKDCYWTIAVEQKLVDKKYAGASDAALVVENPNGKIVKTPFAYTIETTGAQDVEINDETSNNVTSEAEFSSEIDLLAKAKDAQNAPIYFANEFEGKYIITLADELQVEKYGLSIVDGHKLAISKPSNETTITVDLNVVALGLNGSTANVNVKLSIAQTIESVGELSEQNITLSTEKLNGIYAQIVKWNFDELGFTTATQKDAFLKATTKATFVDENGDEVQNVSLDVTGYKTQQGKLVSTNDYTEVEYVGFNLPSVTLIPGEYTVVITTTENNTNNVIFKTETTMNIANPKVEDLFGLASAYTTDGKVLQVVGVANSANISYTLPEGIVEKINGVASNAIFQDLDHVNWSESDGSQTWGAANWVRSNSITIPLEGNEWSSSDNKVEGTERLYKERNIRATYKLFGNSNNTINYDFKVKVLSPVYTEDGSNVTVDESKMTGKFDGNPINTAANIKATYAAGINKGKELNLFAYTPQVNNEASPVKLSGDYIKGTSGTLIEIDHSELVLLGVSVANLSKLEGKTIYLSDKEQTISSVKINGWQYIYNNKETTTKSLYNKYKSLIEFQKTNGTPVTASDEIKDVKFEFVSPNDAAKYCTSIVPTTGAITTKTDINNSDLVNGKAIVEVKMTVSDDWGMSMTKTFNVTISK